MAARFQALADPTRLRLLRLIAAGEPTATECIRHLDQSQPRVARHLRILVEVGLIAARRDGRFVCYTLAGGGAGDILARAALAALASEVEAPAPKPPSAKAPTDRHTAPVRTAVPARAGMPAASAAAQTPPTGESEAPESSSLEDFLL